jgi:hypothetical protein
MDFPLLKTFEVDSKITKFLNKKFNQYSSSHPNNPDNNFFSNEDYNSGYQTVNLLNWNDFEYQTFLKTELIDLISKKLNIKKHSLSYYWTHILDYQNGGMMGEHRHYHNEDFVLFIYLKTCSSGETVFYLNDFCEEYRKRTIVKLIPTENQAAIFSSLVLHEGLFTEENKRIFVAGIRVNNLQ